MLKRRPRWLPALWCAMARARNDNVANRRPPAQMAKHGVVAQRNLAPARARPAVRQWRTSVSARPCCDRSAHKWTNLRPIRLSPRTVGDRIAWSGWGPYLVKRSRASATIGARSDSDLMANAYCRRASRTGISAVKWRAVRLFSHALRTRPLQAVARSAVHRAGYVRLSWQVLYRSTPATCRRPGA